MTELKVSKLDQNKWGCPRCGWPLFREDDMGDGGVTCHSCKAWVPLPDEDPPVKYRVINFSHPLIQESLTKLEELSGKEVDVVTIKVHVDTEKPLAEQVKVLAEEAEEKMPFYDGIVPPGLSSAAVPLFALLDKPDVVVVNKVAGSLPPKHVVSEIISFREE